MILFYITETLLIAWIGVLMLRRDKYTIWETVVTQLLVGALLVGILVMVKGFR